MKLARTSTATVLMIVLGAVWGCGTSEPISDGGDASSTATSDSAAGGGAGSDTAAAEPEFAPLEPFDPPPLAELDAKAEWIDRPVLDGLQLLREKQAKEKPLATVAEALAMRNTSPEGNTKILSALSRLPESDAEVDFDATMTRHLAGDISSTNPVMFNSSSDGEVNSLTGFGIFSFDWNFLPFASKDAAVSWQSSKDRLYDKVVMRDDLTWSDGKPITAHDIAFSFQVIMDPRVPVPAVRSGTDELRWVHAYDDHTLVYFHKEALAVNDWNLNFPIIPKHIYEKSIDEDPTLRNSDYHVKYEDNPVCGGPYLMTKRLRGQEIVLERREDYHMHGGKQVRDKPYFKTVRMRVVSDQNTALLALKKGEIDEMQILSPEQWVTQTDGDDFYQRNTKTYGLEWTYFYFGWNLKTPYFSDKRVRWAMSYAFDYQEMLDKLLYGLFEPCAGEFHPDSWMAPKNPPAPLHQDLDKAEDLLDEAGWTDSDFDGTRDKMIDGRKVDFEFSILCNTTSNVPVQICTLLKQNLEQIGIVCNVRPLEFTVLQQKEMDHDFEAYLGGWGTGTDPYTTENIFKTNEGRNFVQYSNPEVDRLFEDAMVEFDREKRGEMYGKISMILWEDQPYTWLYRRNAFYAFNKDVRGYNYSPRGVYGYSPGFSSLWKAKR